LQAEPISDLGGLCRFLQQKDSTMPAKPKSERTPAFTLPN